MTRPVARRLVLAVVSPEIHRHGGTERVVAEQVDRWKESCDIRVYTMDCHEIDVNGLLIRRTRRPPGPQLFVFVWWMIANSVRRRIDARRLGPPDVTYSAGVNCLNADVVSVHIVFTRLLDVLKGQPPLIRQRLTLRKLHTAAYWRLVRRLEQRVFRHTPELWTASTDHARDLERRFGRARGSVAVVPHGVDARDFSPQHRSRLRAASRVAMGVADEFVLLLFANDVATKGVDIALRAMPLVPPSARLFVVGSLSCADVTALDEWATVRSRTTFVPRAPDVLAYYAAADALIAPSREDVFCLPALEAVACGLPVVVSARAGAAEFLAGHGGVVVIQPDSGELAVGVHSVMSRSGEKEPPPLPLPSWDDAALLSFGVLRSVAEGRSA
ncbi:MAG: glycosyltransferase family 4 protein [Actinobacteria bacterium]|nr:glycosyltransferase family 4 protein [Actinomycetota bacterium]